MLHKINPQQATNEMSVSFRLLSEKSTRLSFSPESKIEALYQAAYNLRSAEYKNATFDNYKRAINLSCQGIKLKNFQSTLAQSNIQGGSVIRESLKKWTNGFGVDKSTLTVQDPFTQDTMEGKPYLLDPGCKHVLEQTSLKQWIEKFLKQGKEPQCMCCRTKIVNQHIDKLVPVRPQPAPIPEAEFLLQIVIPTRDIQPRQEAQEPTVQNENVIEFRFFARQAQGDNQQQPRNNMMSLLLSALSNPAVLNELINGPNLTEEETLNSHQSSPRR